MKSGRDTYDWIENFLKLKSDEKKKLVSYIEKNGFKEGPVFLRPTIQWGTKNTFRGRIYKIKAEDEEKLKQYKETGYNL